MDVVYNDILKIFIKAPDILCGITNIDFSEFELDYKCALVLAVPHRRLLGIDDYIEEEFDKILC